MELLILLALLGFLIFGVWLAISWVVKPLDRAAKNRRYPIQFSLADFLCLFVLMQLPLGALQWAAHDLPALPVLDAMVAAAAIAVWWMCVRTLSRAGIHVVWQRCLALAVVMPTAIFGSFALVFLLIGVMAMLSEAWFTDASWMLAAELAVVGVFYGFGKFTRAIVASSEARRMEQEAAEQREDASTTPEESEANRDLA
jgi:hypothetical protein